MTWIESLDADLAAFVTVLKLTLEAISALCILLGLLIVLRLALVRLRSREGAPSLMKVRLRFGTWLALALEFQLGADILATTIAPSFEALGSLAVIAVIRTGLNYFLQKELEAEAAHEQKTSQRASPSADG